MKKNYGIFVLLSVAMGLTACDDGSIPRKEHTATHTGFAAKLTGHITGADSWPEYYQLVLAGFGDSEYATTQVLVSPDANSNVNLTLPNIGSDEYLHHLADEIEAVKLAEFLLLVDADEQGVVPLALAHYLDAGISHCLFVGRSQGQVGEVDRESLSLAPFDGSCREELLRAVHRIGIMVKVFILEVKTIQHTFAAWVGHHVDASHPIIVGKQCKCS